MGVHDPLRRFGGSENSELTYPQRVIIKGMARGAQGGVWGAELRTRPWHTTLLEIDRGESSEPLHVEYLGGLLHTGVISN